MKILFTIQIFLFTLILFATVTLAQITITSADATAINAVGNVLTNYIDSLATSVNIGSPGATSWDFSALNSQLTNTFTGVVPSSTPYLSDYPSANVVFSFTEIIDTVTADGWQYTTQNSGDYVMNGVVVESAFGTDIMLVKAVYSPAQVLFPLPYTYNSQWNSSFTITNTIYYNGAPFIITTANHTETVLVDAWGNMTMPGGAVLQALRVRRDDRYTSPSPPFYKRVISYSFITKSGTAVEIVANDTTSPNNGTIQVKDGVAWSISGITDVENEDQIPTEYYLSQNYPNPFNPSTTITFSIPNEELVSLKVFNALGEEVSELINEIKPAGNYSVSFNASTLTSGVYFYKISAGNFVETKKMSLMK